MSAKRSRAVTGEETAKKMTMAKKMRIPAVIPEVFPPTEVYVSDKGVMGNVIRILTSSSPSASSDDEAATRPMHAILIPGNPGIAAYYRPFLTRLSEQLGGAVSLHALSLPGMDFYAANGAQRFGIREHEEYMLSYIRSEVLRSGDDSSLTAAENAKPNIILMGHSYGSFLALRLIDRLATDSYERVGLVMLMPCLWEMGRCGGLPLRMMLAFPVLMWIGALCLSLFPPLLKDAVIREDGQCEDLFSTTQRLAAGLPSLQLYANMAHLAGQEVKQIRNPADNHPSAIKRVSSSALAVYVDKDGWCPPQAEQSIGRAFANGSLDIKRVGGGVQHAFVMNNEHNQLVAEAVGGWMEERFKLYSRST